MSQPGDILSPHWQPEADLALPLEPLVCEWLFHDDSLTRRLTALSRGGFSVTPLAEGWQVLRTDECRALGVAEGSEGWVREVYLHGNGQPWVFARSVAARSVLEGSGLNLAQLGNRSLGELLFCEKGFERGVFEVCCYPQAWLPDGMRDDELWARRSGFCRGALQVLVAEVFLPHFWLAAEQG